MTEGYVLIHKSDASTEVVDGGSGLKYLKCQRGKFVVDLLTNRKPVKFLSVAAHKPDFSATIAVTRSSPQW